MAGPQISTTEQPAPEGVTDFRPDEGGTLPLADRAFQAQQAYSDPNFLREAAVIAFRNRQPQGFEFLERSARVAKENGFEAVGHLLRGDGPAALSAFNRSGNFTDATGAKDNGDGTWTITRKGGGTVQINPKTQIESYLNPREYATWKQNQDESAQRASDRTEDRSLRTRQLEIMKQQADQQGKYQEGMNEARKTAAEAAEARAEAAGRAVDAKIAGVGGAGSRKSGTGASSDYMKYRAKLREVAFGEGLRGAELDAEVERGMSADTTMIAPDPSNDGGFLLVSTAGGNQMTIAPFDDFESAAAARASWVGGKGLPKKAAKPPVEDKGPYAPGERPQDAGAKARAPRALTPLPMTEAQIMDESRKLRAVSAEKRKVAAEREQSPQYQGLERQRREALRRGDAKRANAIIEQQKAILNGETGY